MASSSQGFANFDKFEVNGKAVTKLKVEELKAELSARFLTKTGVKKDLVQRLCEALEKENSCAEGTSSPKDKPGISGAQNEETPTEEMASTKTTAEAIKDTVDQAESLTEDKVDLADGTKESVDQAESTITEDKMDSINDTKDSVDQAQSAVMENNKVLIEDNQANKDDTRSSENGGLDDKVSGKATEEVEDGELPGPEDEKNQKNQKPVPEKRRKISLTRQTSNNPPTPGTRKRKWSSNKPKASVVISTDSLKGLIPGVQLASTPALEAVMELDDNDKEDEEMGEVKEEKQGKRNEQETERISSNREDERLPYKRRIVQVADSKTVRLGEVATSEPDKCDLDADESVQPHEVTPSGADSHDSNHSSATPPTLENPTPVKREISPPRNPPSCVIHVSNLVRPFTQKQLVHCLSQFGSVAEEEFWMNKIKSHCYATYPTIDEATNARQSMHGQRWPSTSPKLLQVDFADNEKMLEDTDGALGKKVESKEQKEESVREEKGRSKDRSSRKPKEKKEEVKTDEPSAANLLDKLFRKTTTVPCIYWLPLTKEQIVARKKDREERRKQRRLAMEQEKQAEQKQQDAKKPQDVKREKPRENDQQKEWEISRDKERRPLRSNRAGSPPPRQRPDRRPSPVKQGSRSRSPAFRRNTNRRR